MDIATWLRELGQERYEPVFRDNEIDWEVLAELTEGDLEKLGLPLGPRKKLLKGIAGLSASTSAVSVEATPSAGPVAPEAERRQLTVLFADLVGSTALAARLNPEEMRDVIRAYQDAVAGAVARFGGHIAKFMGDGVLCYFGWPTAHEDAAERAVHAALAIVAAIETLPMAAAERLAARIGIATGLVVVGDLVGTEEARERTVIGETPNLAARLQGLAAPGQIIVAEGTRHLLGDVFELDDLGPQRLKGFGEPLQAFRVLGEGRAESRFEAMHAAGLLPLVGRSHELAILMECWVRAKGGEGQVALISGKPGIGKSRLIHALRQELSGERHLVLSHFCSSYHTSSALYPIIAGGLEAYRATGARLFVPYFLALLGTTHGAAGEGAAGQRLLAKAMDAGRASGERWFEAELYRLQGELSLAGGDGAAAEACFLSAIGFAREQSAKLWELRAATSLARLWREQGRRAEAFDLLARIHGWFTEGFDTADLKEAKALLHELR